MYEPNRASVGCVALLLFICVVLGCGGETGLSDPPPGDDGDLRPGLTLNVKVSPEHGDIAPALGWAAGVPDAEVRVHRFGSDFAWEVTRTNPEGVARFPDLVTGRYRVAVYRPLSNGEATEAGAAALAAGRILTVAGEGTEASVVLGPDQRGSLVISEVYATAPTVADVNYEFHTYFELFNNSDETVFLDGLTFGTELGLPTVESASFTCAESASVRKDPAGVWAHFLHRFPGTGTEHPVPPGRAITVALDAIDHSVIDSRFPDLSDADFELFGSADVDNPDVPNVIEIGIEPYFSGHGLRYFIGQTMFIADRVDPGTLDRRVLAFTGADVEILRIPAAALIDVVWTEDDDALEEQQFEICDGTVHPSFDQLGGGFVKHGQDLTLSVQRILLPGDPGHLQDTNVSAVDLVKGPVTAGTIP